MDTYISWYQRNICFVFNRSISPWNIHWIKNDNTRTSLDSEIFHQGSNPGIIFFWCIPVQINKLSTSKSIKFVINVCIHKIEMKILFLKNNALRVLKLLLQKAERKIQISQVDQTKEEQTWQKQVKRLLIQISLRNSSFAKRRFSSESPSRMEIFTSIE